MEQQRKKLSHNKAEDISRGGAPFNKFVVSATEDTIAKICGIHTVVEGIPFTFDFGLVNEIEKENHNPINAHEIAEVLQEVFEPAITTNRKRKRHAGNNDLDDHIKTQTKETEEIGEKIEGILEDFVKNSRVGKDIDRR